MRRLPCDGALLIFAAVVGLSLSCGGSSFQSGGESGAGSGSAGDAGRGGAGASGGANVSGGGPSNGGTATSGGASSSGGTAMNGGASGSGGSATSGGTPTGGSKSFSGGASSGGASATGGKASTGGRIGTGGAGTGGAAAGASGSAGAAGGCGLGCGQARQCCGDHCVNPNNDPKNCGDCGTVCDAEKYCEGGKCVVPPCEASCGSGALCCGSACCGVGQLCCDPQGPLDRGPACLAPNDQGTCPMGCAPLCVCASPDTPIATPSGDRAIAELRVGDLVYSVDRGRLVTVPIVRTSRIPARNHSVMRVQMAGGRILEISPRHPTADGRTFGDLRSGDSLDGVAVHSAGIVPYMHDATYDILPGSESGTYFAASVLIGSTLAGHSSVAMAASAACMPAPVAISPLSQ